MQLFLRYYFRSITNNVYRDAGNIRVSAKSGNLLNDLPRLQS
jgi:hypothetical protein